MSKNEMLITVLDTTDQATVAILRTALDDEKIPYVMKGEFLYRNRSLQVQVNRADEKKVRQIIKKFNNKKVPAA